MFDNIQKKLLLAVLLISSLFFALAGGFRVNHIDTEYHKTLYNKSYFLHNIYHLASKFEFEIKKTIHKERTFLQTLPLSNFKKINQRNGISIYLVNGFFVLLGILACLQLAFLLTENFWLSYLAAWILASCYFWNAEAHYTTTDVPLSALIISFIYFLSYNFIHKNDSENLDPFYEGLLLGACFAVKYAGLILIAPYLYFKYKTKEFQGTFTPIAIAFIFLFICIGDKVKKLWHYLTVELKVQTEDGWAGYNSDEPGLLYHLRHSFYDEYGLTLSLLALIGFFFLYKRFQDDKERKIILDFILIFLVLLLIMISSTVIKTVRFSLPAIPLLAIFSSCGIYQIFLFVKNKNSSLAKIISTILIMLAIVPALKNTLRHDYLMAKPDTVDLAHQLRKAVKKYDAINIILDDKKLFDKTPNLDDIQYIKRCISTPKNFKEIFKFDQFPNLVVSTNSFKLDRFIFDKKYHCDNGHKAFIGYEDLKLLIVTPFKIEKDKVPFSFISNFSPRKPDLDYRNYRGAYFEIFYTKPEYETIFKKLCEAKNYPCKFVTGKDSYFLTKMQTSFIDPKVREKLASE